MPHGGYREPHNTKKIAMEELPCIGCLSVERPHTFKRPVGDTRRQCDRCWKASAFIHVRQMIQPLEQLIT